MSEFVKCRNPPLGGATSGTIAERGVEDKGAGDDLTMVLQSGTEGPVLRAFSRISPEIVTEMQDDPPLRRRGGGAGAGRVRPSSVFVDFGSGMDDALGSSVDPEG